MFVIESDATIVAPLMLRALLECKREPGEGEQPHQRGQVSARFTERALPPFSDGRFGNYRRAEAERLLAWLGERPTAPWSSRR